MLHSLAADNTSPTSICSFVILLRLDALPARVQEYGLTVPTIAHGLCTPPSLASLVTGQYPLRHGIEWFGHPLADPIPSMFDIEGINPGFTSMWDSETISTVVGDPPARTLNEVNEPFFLLEHDHGGHVNYPDYRDLSPERMLRDHIDAANLWENYRAGVGESVGRFFSRLRELARFDLLDETLVIFTSDHGELLDERGGFIGHRLPACPELFEVPTVFIHPNLPAGAVAEGYIRHVDLYPTVHHLLTGGSVKEMGNHFLNDPIPHHGPTHTWWSVRPPHGGVLRCSLVSIRCTPEVSCTRRTVATFSRTAVTFETHSQHISKLLNRQDRFQLTIHHSLYSIDFRYFTANYEAMPSFEIPQSVAPLHVSS